MAKIHGTPIGEHGVIGDLETLALVGHKATIEWFCWPRFDSPSVFGSILDPDGGSWSIRPQGGHETERGLYLPDTNVLISRFHTESGVVEVEDLMVVDEGQRGLVRRVLGVRGTVQMESVLQARPDYGRANATIAKVDSNGTISDCIRLAWPDQELFAMATAEQSVADGCVISKFTINEGEEVRFGLGQQDLPIGDPELCDRTVAFWKNWISSCTYSGAWSETVKRSALALKLLTHSDSGGLLAAGTASLPEAVGGERNWDYRYVWIRDAAFTLYAFLELGFKDEADAFTSWLTDRLAEGQHGDSDNGPLNPLYTIDGSTDVPETFLDHWSGYADSSPVRVGNGAAGQLQLDIYGELMDSMYLADKYGPGLSVDVWNHLRNLVDWVCENWDRPDDGMWEVRSGPQRFTSSAVLCWVAIERGMRMARFRGRPADMEHWRSVRDQIHNTVMTEGWNNDLQTFTQIFGGDTVDASILLMPLTKFISPTDPRWRSTLSAVGDRLAHGALVDRYDNSANDDGLEGDDGSFSICSFWYVEALARSGDVDGARRLFEKMLTYAGPLGLFSEVISPNGRQLGNYPQAFTHLSLISAAVHLNQFLEDQ